MNMIGLKVSYNITIQKKQCDIDITFDLELWENYENG